ncbi:protein translocase subunit SecD [Candidatus Microgenomates bacterium]|nr:protein translocase subunit SecD [Candidatus Microgenomates bacterium]
MRRKIWFIFIFILTLAVFAGVVDWPKGPDIKIGSFYRKLDIHQGLDLLGGTHLVYEADMIKINPKERDSALEGVKKVIERRINGLGVSEPIIQTTSSLNSYRIIIELPGISDVEEAVNLIGQTAQLEFREGIASQSLDENGQFKVPGAEDINNWKDIGLTGALFKKANVQVNQSTFEPEINISFNDEGATIFTEATGRNVGKPLAIFLDKKLLSAPKVNQKIEESNAVISGGFDIKEAKNLAIQLNAGALPVPISLAEQRNVGATLGQDSVHKSFVAGLIGVLAVILFMLVYYRLPGLLSALALSIYSLIVMALFKIIPVTMTLAGIAGFILSIGMAVDANILIFERMKEELRRGKTFSSAVKAGFDRAWSSIRDSNVSSLITCIILFYFGTGLIRGFALTLAIGILVSMFSAITVTRIFLLLLIGTKISEKKWLFGSTNYK